jgi:TolB protein
VFRRNIRFKGLNKGKDIVTLYSSLAAQQIHGAVQKRRLNLFKRVFILLFISGTAFLCILLGTDIKLSAAAASSPDQNIRQVTTDPALAYNVKWSPDGKTLAFASQRSGEPKIWLVPVNGGDPVMLETGLSGDHHISWAPDSRHIVFDARYQGRPNIFSISLDGEKPKRLSEDGAFDFQPYWSPDGSRIAFASLRSGNEDIWIISVSGGEPVRFTKEFDNSWPTWSPDGKKIAFASKREGENNDIWVKEVKID